MGKIKSNLLGFAEARWCLVVILAILIVGFGTATRELMQSLSRKTGASKPSTRKTVKTPSIVKQGDKKGDGGVTVGYSYHNDPSPPLRNMKPVPGKPREREEEENENPKIP